MAADNNFDYITDDNKLIQKQKLFEDGEVLEQMPV